MSVTFLKVFLFVFLLPVWTPSPPSPFTWFVLCPLFTLEAHLGVNQYLRSRDEKWASMRAGLVCRSATVERVG